ncbi:DUF4394 domain-containing protein [Baekduia sp.]|jgi:hypothetical protein|uniref:DUF4394 domain-containing protein n=1 Tax=Baekduia sp. TaxID=2600305 RepID=UPI002E02A98B|nr:DUF4394 domain-containing protein [Baekduia sp.]
MSPFRLALAVVFLTVIAAAPARANEAEPMYGLIGGTQLVAFTTGNATSTSSVALTGIGSDLIQTLDVRPATGELYGLAGSGQLYRIDTVTGAATAIGTPLTYTGDAELDFDPVSDTIRIVTSTNDNIRVDPVTGTQTTAAGLSSSSAPRGVAYTNGVAGATSTTAYSLGSSSLWRLGGFGGTLPSADSGTLTAIGAHNKAVSGPYGFDISPVSGRAFFATFNDSTSPCSSFSFCLERLDLGTGAPVPALALNNLNGIAIAPPTSPIFLGSRLFAAREGDGNAVVTVRRSGDTRTAATATYTLTPGTAGAGDFATAGGSVTFAPGESSKPVSVPITDDADVEPAETFTITVAATTGTGTFNGSPTTATVEIFDNDATPAATPGAGSGSTPTATPDTTKPTVLAFGAPTAKLKAFLKGYKITASCSEACTLTSTAKLGTKTVGTLTGTLNAAGIFKGTLRPSKAGGKALKKKLESKKAKPAKLTIATVATDTSKLSGTSTATVKVSRS